MRLLDCGCGVGSITAGLAAAVAPGPVVGLDLDPRQLGFARRLLDGRGAGPVRLAAGSVYALPFADASFDAAHVHAVLFHLREPLRALREIRRVLAPGGVVGVCDDDDATRVIGPVGGALEEAWALVHRALDHNRGARPYAPRRLRGMLLEAGFARAEGHAVGAEAFGTPEATRNRAAGLARVLTSPTFVDVVVRHGWADRAALDHLAREVVAWGEQADAFEASLYCAAVGWVTDGDRSPGY